jgi:hypothetical protein
VLAVHSTLRWLVVVAGLLATVAAWAGRLGRRSWTRADSLAARRFVIGMDIQVVVGVILYGVFSPAVASATLPANRETMTAQRTLHGVMVIPFIDRASCRAWP